MNRIVLSAVTAGLVLSGCGGKKAKVAPTARAPIPAAGTKTGNKTGPATGPAPQTGQIERGVASWYGPPYHGRQAADGEIYDMETMVAAHRTLPFQTMVRVRNLANDKTADVRIIDRGPFVGGRIIDLSKAAARQIELLGPGVGQVEITILAPPANPEAALFAVQVGAFRERTNADRAQQRMQLAYGTAKIVERAGSPTPWRVLAGRENSQSAAADLAQRIRTEQQEMPEAFVVRLDP